MTDATRLLAQAADAAAETLTMIEGARREQAQGFSGSDQHEAAVAYENMGDALRDAIPAVRAAILALAPTEEEDEKEALRCRTCHEELRKDPHGEEAYTCPGCGSVVWPFLRTTEEE